MTSIQRTEVRNSEHVAPILNELLAEMFARKVTLAQHGVVDVKELPASVRPVTVAVRILLDAFVSSGSPVEDLKPLTQYGRSVGLYVTVPSSYADSTVLPAGTLKANLNSAQRRRRDGVNRHAPLLGRLI